MAFVGSEVITFDAVTTYGLQAEWVAGLLKVQHLQCPHLALCLLACVQMRLSDLLKASGASPCSIIAYQTHFLPWYVKTCAAVMRSQDITWRHAARSHMMLLAISKSDNEEVLKMQKISRAAPKPKIKT